MSERDDYASLFQSHLPFIERVVAVVARRLCLRGADAEDFGEWVKERLWEGDYEVLRKWRAESRLTTYLTTVIANLGREYRVQEWGRWRPSAAAIHAGPLSVRLETLVYRDGFRFTEAVELLRTRGEAVETDRQLAERLSRLPPRTRLRPDLVSDDSIESVAGPATADEAVLQWESDAERRAVTDALHRAMAQLPLESRVVLRLHYFKGNSIADIARALGLEQRPLYRARDRALSSLARFMEADGVTTEQVRQALGGAFADAQETTAGDNDDSLPSKGSEGDERRGPAPDPSGTNAAAPTPHGRPNP